MNIAMTTPEIGLLKKILETTTNYFEYGCGGSTVLACKYTNIKKIISVDSSINWIGKVKDQLTDQNKVKFLYVDIEADENAWGAPKKNSNIENWRNYSLAISQQDEFFDTILVDGRFRVACCISSFYSMNQESKLILHDCNREQYAIVEEFLFKVEQENNLAVFIKKQNYNINLLPDLYEKFKNNYA